MNDLGSSSRGVKRHSRDGAIGKVVLDIDLNFPPIESPSDRASGSRQSRGSRGSRRPYHATGQQNGSAAPSSSFVDVELIEDEVVTLSSSRGFPVGRNRSKRNQPMTMISDEDPEPNLRRPEEQAATSSFITCNKLVKASVNRTITNCDLHPVSEAGHGVEDFSREVIRSTWTLQRKLESPEPEAGRATAKQPTTFNCPVCLDELVNAAATICGHIFCATCTRKFIQTQKKCPTCRRKLTMKSFHRVYLPI